ncbi:hypothetical protein HMPREF1092_03164 [Clostridium thermobutyricum]|uniref:Uncharacterized protein n=1 Tax=Clostridium thermobutyricum TaxID=29372 RepID=N9XJZ8_9CLOT|nr:hypothetical protein HMPREF1092_03164 [Clostridium thermobutyricum]
MITNCYYLLVNQKRKMDSLERWLEFLIEPESNTVRQLELSDEAIEQTKTELYRLSMNSKEREMLLYKGKSYI